MMRLLLELGCCLLLGMGIGQRWSAVPDRLAPWLIGWGLPLSLSGLLLRAGLVPLTLRVALFTLVCCAGGLLIAACAPPLRSRLGCSSFLLGAVVGNTGYIGLPVAIALLPPEVLSISITVDLVGTLVTWSLGPLLLHQRDWITPREFAALLLRTPAIRALLLALPLALTPWRASLGALLWWPAQVLLWLLLLLVGMRLGALLGGQRGSAAGPLPAGMVLLPLLGKLLLWPLLIWPLAMALGLRGMALVAVVLQAATPTAMSVLLLAEASPADRRSREVPAALLLVVTSTLTAVLTLPLWWLLLTQVLAQR